jgi:hypothetical protein
LKKIIFGMTMFLAALMGTASAQMVGSIKVALPSAASVGGVTLPAGEYTVRALNDDGGSAVMQISSLGGKSVFALARQVAAPKGQQITDEPTLILKNTGAGYQIQTIWLGGQENGYEFIGK